MVFTDVLIREATPDDARGVISAIKDTLEEPDNHLNTLAEEFTNTTNQETEFIEQLAANPNSLMIVAESLENSEIVALLTCIGDTKFSRQHCVRLMISVMQTWRGQGIGTRLIEEAIRWAGNHPKIRRMELEVLTRNTRAIALYTRMGFRFEGTGIGAVRKGDEYLDVYWMVLPVTKSSILHQVELHPEQASLPLPILPPPTHVTDQS